MEALLKLMDDVGEAKNNNALPNRAAMLIVGVALNKQCHTHFKSAAKWLTVFHVSFILI